MTDIGYKWIKDSIINRTIEPPKAMTTHEMCAWLSGYAKCQNDILELIDKLSKGQKE